MTERRPPGGFGRRCVKVNAMSQAKLIKLLLRGVYTCEQLAEKTGLHYVTVLQYTRELWLAGAAYIDHWEKDSRGRDNVKVYRVGIGSDAKRTRLTSAERQARSRAKQKAVALLHMTARPIYESHAGVF